MPRAPKSILALLAGALTLSACGSTDGSSSPAVGAASPAGGSELEHIHGLGEDPATGQLFVATHFGLFEASAEGQRLNRAGESRQDTMGFSVVDGKRFLGSGHPDPAVGGPGNLGLIESNDQGRTWKPISLAGEADFHVLRSSGRYVYGVSGGGLMVSRDGGSTWTTRKPPGGVFDVAIDPSSPRRIVASTDAGVFTSGNAGAAWKPGADDRAGLLAWPRGGELTLVDGEGVVSRSTDDGRTFKPTGGNIGGAPVAFASGSSSLLAALGDGRVQRSTDAGATWSLRAQP